ncbi:MAG: hypothetical protein LBI48_09215 [Burkholderiaceae bacterium]|nr:hypothetical protein [Burkholderiaceae bacterium]
MLGWKAYFGLSQTPEMWRKLDKWTRRRLRALQLKQWRTSQRAHRQLPRLGATPPSGAFRGRAQWSLVAQQCLGDSSSAWHCPL